MAGLSTLILSNGGLRSLVATAAVRSDPDAKRVSLLHLSDGRASASRSAQFVALQAAHFRIVKIHEVLLAQQVRSGSQEAVAGDTAPDGTAPLHRPRMLLQSLEACIELGIDRLVWPGQFDGDHEQIAAVTEQIILLEQLAQLSHEHLPTIETPLLELTDTQVLELGSHLEVPWKLAWSCQLHGEKPCMVCPPCRRRQQIFEHAGLADPIDTRRTASSSAG